MGKYEPKHFPSFGTYQEAEDRDRIATALERIADVQEKILSLALDSQAQKKEMAEKMKEVFRRSPPEAR